MQLQIQERTGSENKRDEQGDGKVKTAAVTDLSHGIVFVPSFLFSTFGKLFSAEEEVNRLKSELSR